MTPRNHGKLWSLEDELTVIEMYRDGRGTRAIAEALGRMPDSIAGRCHKYGLCDEFYEKWKPRDSDTVEIALHLIQDRIERGNKNWRPSTSFIEYLNHKRAEASASTSSEASNEIITTEKDDTMNTKLFSLQHLVNGQDITTMSDNDLYNAIAAAQADIDRLEKINPKPNRLVKQIETKKADLGALVAFINEQDAGEER